MKRQFHLFSIRERIESFRYALAGLRSLISTQHNAWIHALCTLIALGAGTLLPISRFEWLILIMGITLVWVAEALNTAMEFLCDAAIPDFHPLVEKAKDVAAGAVFISAIAALCIGILIFTPHLFGG
ncbi:diacylglycerol kinase family protein [Chitinivibrio alkaliphilus]|uniref:Diacylglycerol kinase n=1 Tax=Chitinivibrio alkaliphilus ACht1 TaxID=1313304 RepID=U7D613_9BACT|nr:diacylglycerol kinase family protein [Chitinivibrio alkaliphilus]ERP31954.1 diacylglycerol kinase [Chitinivibrio alkaliphilus ACht1]